MITLFNLNIEGDKHIDRIIPYLQNNTPDVICFQEVFQADLPRFEIAFGMQSYFAPTMNIQDENPFLSRKGIWGLALFLKKKIISFNTHYYVGKKSKTPRFIKENPNSGNRAVSWVTFENQDKIYSVATTHFTWSQNGNATEEQKINMQKLLFQLKRIEPFILCGDFNAPRGKEVFKMLSDTYKDNIPKETTSTIDSLLHREGDLNFVVDGLFTTPHYCVKHVRIISGLSDHKGICATIV